MTPRPWWKLFSEHHEHAARKGQLDVDRVVHALLAIAQVERGQLQELRRIRKLLEAGRGVTALGLTARTIDKDVTT